MESKSSIRPTLQGPSNFYFNIGELLLVLIPPIMIILLMGSWAGNNPVRSALMVWISYLTAMAVIWAGLRLRGESLANFGLSIQAITIKDSIKAFGTSLVIFVLATSGFILGGLLMANISGAPEAADFTKYDYLQGNFGKLMLTLVGVYIISSFGEELIFRGFLINRIAALGKNTKMATTVAVVLSAIIFGFAHFAWGWVGIVQTTFMGLVLGICYIKLKKSLWTLVLAHVYMDTLLMVQMYLSSN